VTSAAGVLAMARDLAGPTSPQLKGMWPRAVALLARQALETAVEDVWEVVAPHSQRVSMRARLLCFEEFLPAGLAGEVAYTWTALSNAVHFHPYELAPTGVEIEQLLDLTAAAVESLEDARGPA
jgi:hypothetical protein